MDFGVFLLPLYDNKECLSMKYRAVDKDILVVIALTLVVVVLALAVPPDIIAIRILTLPLVLVLPGYALTEALLTRQTLGITERLVFSLGLSLVIVIVGGLVLNWTPFGLHTSTWAVFLGGITLGASAIAFLRRRGQSSAVSGWSGVGSIGFTFGQGLLLGLAAFIVCGAVAVSILGAEQQPRPGFTQLWILPGGGTANAKDSVRLGMSNMESKAMQYRLAVREDGKVVKEWPSIDLKPNEKWEATLMLSPTGDTGTARVEAELYRTDDPTTVYRDVVLVLST